MAQAPHFNFMNMSNIQLLQNNQQSHQTYVKAMKDAASSVQLHKLSKKQLQSMATDLRIQEKLKKEEISAKIPEILLNMILSENQNKPLEMIMATIPALRNHEILFQLFKKYSENINKHFPQQQQQQQYQQQQQQQQQQQFPRTIPTQLQMMYMQQILPNFLSQNQPMFQQNPLYLQQQLRNQQNNPYFSQNQIGLPNINQNIQGLQGLQLPIPWANNELIQPPLQQQQLHQQQQQQQQQSINSDSTLPTLCPCKIYPQRRQPTEFCQEVQCINCDSLYHSQCIKLAQNEVKLFECPACILNKLDPIHQVTKTLCKPQLIQQGQAQLAFLLTMEDYQSLGDKSYQIEVRSIRVDAKYMHEITWPDFCEIYLNQSRLQDLKPLKSNSSLKKRKDDVQVISLQILGVLIKSGYNQIQVKENNSPLQICESKNQFKLCEDGVYCVGVYLTKKRPNIDLVNSIKINNMKSKEECLQLIEESCLTDKVDSEIQIDKITIKISLKCQFDSLLIQTPARGRFCKHVQCFSLENTITMTANCQPRKWKCPICKKKIFDMQVDTYQLEIIDKYREQNMLNIKEIVFDMKGIVQNEIFDTLDSSDDENERRKINQPPVIPINDDEEQKKQKQQADSYNIMMKLISQQMVSPELFNQYKDQDPQQLQSQLNLLQTQNIQLILQQQQQHQKLQYQQMFQQINKPELLPQQNKLQLKQLMDNHGDQVPQIVTQISNSLNDYSLIKFKQGKIIKFAQWKQEQTFEIQQQINNEDKFIYKSMKVKEKLLRIVKKQFTDIIKKDLTKIDPLKIQINQQSQQKKTIYKLSDESSQPPIVKIKSSQLPFNKLLADSIIAQNPGHQHEKVIQVDDKQQNQEEVQIQQHQEQQVQPEQQQQQQAVASPQSQAKKTEKPSVKPQQKQPHQGLNLESAICID